MKNVIILCLVFLSQLSFAKNGLPTKCHIKAERIASEAIYQGYAGARPSGMNAMGYTSSYMNQDNRQQEDYTFVYFGLPTGVRTKLHVSFVVQSRNTCIMTHLNLKFDPKTK